MRRRIFAGVLLCATIGWMVLLVLIAGWRDPQMPHLLGLDPGAGSTLETYLAHLVLFGVLGILVFYNVCSLKRHRVVLPGLTAAFLVGLIWGAATEWYQLYVSGREASFLDALTNTIGSSSGGIFALGLYALSKVPAYRSQTRKLTS